MAKLYFKHGVMGASKSLDLIRSNFNYRERGLDTLVFTPTKDTRKEINKITSRTGMSVEAIPILEKNNIFDIAQWQIEIRNRKIKAIFIDEINFLTTQQIEQLADIVDILEVSVLAYGLKNDFQSHLFPATKRLLELADEIEEIKAMCWCGKKATQNPRIINDHVVREGEQIQVGGNELYTPLCRKHFKTGELGN